ncbi:MAG: cytosol nonspecific dipeptidase [Thermoplasmata archaeon HGW-Thermoplasmata-1]|nr:MAG: cytosol nonspecific dipeptidase [Thermoplasmata archaeon HGW-Thermoplasmata-1]
MQKTLKELKPQAVWKHFDDICAIPHGSKNEKAIFEHLVAFAKENNLEYETDDVMNIVIRKPASKGMEKAPGVVLQGHMDMVCEKNSGIEHDFERDAVKTEIRGNDGYLYAHGTTLGADNGIGMAVALALLGDKDARHGPLEALFTVDEETGLTGAFALSGKLLRGKYLINLDSEDHDTITIGCAGGGDSKLKLKLERAAMPKGCASFEVKVSGLKGGHSGVDIHQQRANAIKLLSRMLWEASGEFDLFVIDIKGGDKHNAIPREASAKIAISAERKAELEAVVGEAESEMKSEFSAREPDMRFSVSAADAAAPFTQASTKKLLSFLYALPHGVQKMSYDIEGFVQTSTNLAAVKVEGDTLKTHHSTRSSVKSELEAVRHKIGAIADLAAAKIEHGNAYPGWKPDPHSKLLGVAKGTYEELFGGKPRVEAIHAGLECGIIMEKCHGMEAISIGPQIENPHSPDERVRIDTVQKIWDYVTGILERLN